MGGTLIDIRKRTGLSLSTISKYINGGNVLPENKKAIDRAIEELHYEVNEVARGLKTKKTNIVGVLIHDLNNIFAGTIISKIEDILRQHGYGMFICDCRGDAAIEEAEIKFLLGKRVDGIITIPTSENARYLEAVVERKIPIVLIDRSFEGEKFDSVIVNNEKAAYDAAYKLIAYGHRKIGIICGNDDFFTARARLKGYVQALNEQQCMSDGFIMKGPLSVEHGYNALKKLMAMKDRPTAVFLSNYEITLGAVIAMNELGISFPEDISVIGFDNMLLANVVRPKLWMVSQPMETIAERAAEMMLERLMGDVRKKERMEVLDTELIVGESIKQVRI